MSKRNKNRRGQGKQQGQHQTSQQAQAQTGGAAQATASSTQTQQPQPVDPNKVPDHLTDQKVKAILAKLATEDEPEDFKPPTDPIPEPTALKLLSSTDCIRVEGPSYKAVLNGWWTTSMALFSIAVVLIPVFLFIILVMVGIGLTWKPASDLVVMIPTAFFLCGLCLLAGYEHVVVQGEPQKLKIMGDSLSDYRIVAFGQKLSLKPWWYVTFKVLPEINLYQYIEVKLDLEILTLDNIMVKVGARLKFLPSRSHITAFLGYQPVQIIKDDLEAMIENRLNKAFKGHSYETLSMHRDKVMDWGGKLLGGAHEQTPFEVERGIIVTELTLTKYEPAEESKSLAQGLARARLFAKIVRKVRINFPDMPDNQVVWNAWRTMQEEGLVDTRATIDATPGIKTVFMNDDIGGVRA